MWARRRRFDNRPVRREIAAQYGDSRMSLERLGKGADDFAVPTLRFGDVLPYRTVRSRSALPVQDSGFCKFTKNDRHTSRIEKIFHQVLARRLKVDQAGQAETESIPIVQTQAARRFVRQSQSNGLPRWSIRRWLRWLKIAFSNASRVRIFDMQRSSLHHLDDAPARHLRERIATSVDRGNSGVAGQSSCPALRPCWPWLRRYPWSCSGPSTGACNSPRQSIPQLHFARADIGRSFATTRSPNRNRCP